MVNELYAVLFYLFTAIGSFSLGYLVLRFVYPEIRTFDAKNKAITVTVVGIAITITTIAADYSFAGQRVFSLDSFSMPLMFIITGFYFLVLRAFFIYSSISRQFIMVGIPIATTTPAMQFQPKPTKEVIVVEKEKIVETVVQKTVEVKGEKPAEISRKIEEIKQQIQAKQGEQDKKKIQKEEKQAEKEAEKQEQRQAEQSAKMQAELEKLEKTISQKLEKEKLEEVKKLEDEKKQLEKKFEDELKKNQDLKKAQEEEKKVEQTKRELELKKLAEQRKQLEEKLASQEKIQQKRDQELELQKKRAAELEKLEVRRKQEEKQQEKEQVLVQEKRAKEQEIQAKELSAKQDEARKKRLKESIGDSQTYLEKIKIRVDELKKTKAKKFNKDFPGIVSPPVAVNEVKEIKQVEQLKQLKKQSIAEPVEVKLEISRVTPIVSSIISQPVVVPVSSVSPSQSETRKKVDEVKKKIEEKRAQEKNVIQLVQKSGLSTGQKIIPTVEQKKSGGFFDFLFGKSRPAKSDLTKPATLITPVPLTSATSIKAKPITNPGQPKLATKQTTAGQAKLASTVQVPATSFATWRSTKEAERQKVEDQKKAIEQKKKEEAELQQLIKSVTRETTEQAAAQDGPVHRRYLLKDEVNVIANKDVAQKEEFGVMVQDIYTQLRDTQTTTQVSDILKVDTPKPQTVQQLVPSTEQSAQRETHKPPSSSMHGAKDAGVQSPSSKPEAGLSMSDILGNDLFASQKSASSLPVGGQSQDMFSTESGMQQPAGGSDIFAQLSAASSGEAQQAPVQVKSDVSFVQIPADKGVGCPTCHSKSSKIIFCPYCSTGMCANCSPSIKPIGPGQFIYTCPKCNEEVNVKKKAV